MVAKSDAITFIGAGNMATALIEGLLASGTCQPDAITATDVRTDALAALKERLGIHTASHNDHAVRQARCVVIAVKPQQVVDVLTEFAPHLPKEAVVVSIAAGVRLQTLAEKLPPQTAIVRAMPNTPALVRQGATAVAAGAFASEADLMLARRLFDSVGLCVKVREEALDAVTALSGSGPAYTFRFIEILIQGGVAAGLSADTAHTLALQTVLGAAQLLRVTGKSPETLRNEVTSPGGTTLAGLDALAHHGFEASVLAALSAAEQRSRELGKR